MQSLDGLEVLINHPLARDSQKIHALAPVAAARFASNYDGGVPSWAHCGTEVERLYRANQARFRYLMESSFQRYGVPIVKRPGADLLFETVVCQAGLPSGMLKRGGLLRELLLELMAAAAQGHNDLLRHSGSLILEQARKGNLRKAYQEAGHLPKLCADLVLAVIRLTEKAGWDGGPLDALWAPDWDRDLPFLVDQDAARDIVSQLLDVAVTAAAGSGLEVERILSRANGDWRFLTRVLVPAEGVELPREQPDVVSVHYTVTGESAGEACRLRRQEGVRYTLPRPVQDLNGVPADRAVSLALREDEGFLPLDCRGGEPLETAGAWVFDARGGDYVYRTPAPTRLCSQELFVAAPAQTEVAGDAIQLPGVMLGTRALWKVTGRALFTGPDGEPALVEAGYAGPQVYLHFKGKPAAFQVKGFTTVFIGNPEPRRQGGLGGRIEWRRAGSTDWQSSTTRSVTGQLSFRLVDFEGEALAERRRVLVLPDSFRPEVGPKTVSFTLPPGYSAPGATAGSDGRYVFEFGSSSRLDVTLASSHGELTITFDRPNSTSFVDVATGESTVEGRRRIDARSTARIRAVSTQHEHVYVRRTQDRWSAVHPIPLRNGALSLGAVAEFLAALAYHPGGRTYALTVQFENGPAVDIDAHRIRRGDATLEITDAHPDTRIELRSLTHFEDTRSGVVEVDRVDATTWRLPDLGQEAPFYLAIDTTHRAAPCLVPTRALPRGGDRTFLETIAIPEVGEREQALVRLYERITEDPNDASDSAQLDVCLGWLGEFQFELCFLDPFLVLAARPRLALRMLCLARVRDSPQAEQGLTWALDAIPFFWHGVTGAVVSDAMDWASRTCGAQTISTLVVLLTTLESSVIPRMVMQANAGLHSHAERWHSAVLDWGGRAEDDVVVRSHSLGDKAVALWQKSGDPRIQAALCQNPRSVPTSVDICRTRLCAPFELATATVLGIEVEKDLIDDFAYARYVIDKQRFDEAYAAAVVFLEKN
ncbi:hypothetical protein EGK76_00235 [Luteimonas sp. 100069]|nr:hypothetical protein EGK76_00235 [Luteimonas sp. 100069]